MKLSRILPWDLLEKEFEPFYAEDGRPAKNTRFMVGLLILKSLINLSDEQLIQVMAW